MKIDSERPDFVVPVSKENLDFADQPLYKDSPQNSLGSTWVKLLQLPNPFSFEEALLLCPLSDYEWLAWIPDYGEAVLCTWQFSQDSRINTQQIWKINFGQLNN